MKTYEEMAQSALARGKAMRKQRKKNSIIFTGVLSSVAAVLVMAIGIGMLVGENRIPGGTSGPAQVGSNPTTGSAQMGSDPTTGQPDGPGTGPLNYGQISYLSPDDKIGKGFQYISGTANPGASQPNAEPPQFEFQRGYIHVVAKAIEEVGIYETLNAYGSTQTYTYRVFAMQVIDPLESGMETGSSGTFFYLLPSYLQGDLTQYDALLISMYQLPHNFVLRNEDALIAVDYLFTDPRRHPELGNLIAFTDGVFDESLWQDISWIYGYQFIDHLLDRNDDRLLVFRGSTLEEALQRRQAQIEKLSEWAKPQTVKHYDFQTDTAKQVMDYVRPFENGVFVPVGNSHEYLVRRYINGCPTNEWIQIDMENETITTSDYRFEDADFENLPDLAAYITSLDLSKIAPQHTDPNGKLLIYNSAVGWYEKTETGVYSIVRIAWRYFAEDDYYLEYYDETFILLDETGDHIISREELIKLIGDNQNISNKEYGVGIEMPMC